MSILRDIKSGALPKEEIFSFVKWLIRKSWNLMADAFWVIFWILVISSIGIALRNGICY